MDAERTTADRRTPGLLLETFLYQEPQRPVSWHDPPVSFLHIRAKDGVEVNIVMKRGAQTLAGEEVKAEATDTAPEFRGLWNAAENGLAGVWKSVTD